jgi:hypothetical protein
MKTINLFDRELTFKNEELYKAAKLALSLGYKVHTFNPSGKYICQIFVDNGVTFGSISEHYSGVRYSTCHKSKHGSGNGTGFGLTEEIAFASKEGIESCFIFAPYWASNTGKIKKQSWEEYQREPITQILTYSEIKL